METIKITFKAQLSPARLAGILLFSLIAACCGLPGAALAAGGESVGYVSRIKGAAFAVQGDELRPMERSALVGRTDVLKTGPDGALPVGSPEPTCSPIPLIVLLPATQVH